MSRIAGQYELVRCIGRGGMAEVWMGRRASVGGATKSVAIKFMSARVAGDARHRRMFLAEARLSMLMNHSNVVQVFDAGEQDGRLFLVMEWIDGLNLAQLCELRRRAGEPWPVRVSGYVIGEILRGLAYAHNLMHEGRVQCVVHRDVSPHNVLVSASGEVKLADFGVARLATEETSGLHIKGKLRYMAPEHLAGRSREPTVDLYGAGAILHELLSGERFRDEADELDLYGHILGGRIPPLRGAGVPPELVSLREGLLQPEVRQRIPTATRALEYLEAWAGFRSAAAELGELCRGYMGVTGPRSGIESRTFVDAYADTVAPSVATRTSGITAQAVPTSAPTASSVAVTRADGASSAGSRRAWLVAAGVLGAGFVLGGIGVAIWRVGEEAPAGPLGVGSGSVAGSGPTEGSGSGPRGSGGTMGGEPTGGEPTGGEPTGGEPTGPSESGPSESGPFAEPGPPADGSGGSGGSEGSGGSGGSGRASHGATTAGEDSAADEPRPARRGRASVQFGLQHPLRAAWVRIGRGKPFVVDLVGDDRVRVPAGTRTLYWKGSEDAVWVDGGRFEFEAGRQYRIRLTTRGPVRE